MAWPGDETPGGPGDPGQLRASHADRDQVIDDLKAAFVAGMLAKDELELRVDQVLSSRTYADLADITADLPGGLAGEEPPNPAETRAGQPLVQPGQIITGATLLYLGAWLSVPGSAAAALALLGGFYYLCILAIAVATIFENRHDERSDRQLPKGHAPGAGGLTFLRLRVPVHLITTAALGASPRSRPCTFRCAVRRSARRGCAGNTRPNRRFFDPVAGSVQCAIPSMTWMDWRPAEPWRHSGQSLPIRIREASADWLSAYS
jgi:hypothetical protein